MGLKVRIFTIPCFNHQNHQKLYRYFHDLKMFFTIENLSTCMRFRFKKQNKKQTNKTKQKKKTPTKQPNKLEKWTLQYKILKEQTAEMTLMKHIFLFKTHTLHHKCIHISLFQCRWTF